MNKQVISPEQLIEGDIFEILNLQGLSETEKTEMMQKLIDSLNSRVLIRIDDEIKEEEKGEWFNIIETEDQDIINNFLVKKNIDLKRIITEEALLLKKGYIELVNNSQERQ